MAKRKKPKPQIHMTRTTWESLGFVGSPATKVIANKKGKGSYKRVKKIKEDI